MNLGKHRKKDQEKEALTITEDYAIINAANSLLYAEELARLNADSELLLSISDRWLNLSKFLILGEELSKDRPFGFVGFEGDDDGEHKH